jgi:hypothetical protein
MATNLLAPSGLSFSRNVISGANTYQGNQFTIKAGYATAIGKGDIVKIGTGGSQGYVVLGAFDDANILGVFSDVLPYYDSSAQQYMHGLNGSWPTTANPAADVGCLVYSDPFSEFIVQVSGGPFVQSWIGNNINFLTGTNGAPNAAGNSTLVLDGSSVATTATFPFRITGLAGVTGGPNDPANTNPWITVRFNTSSVLNATGI